MGLFAVNFSTAITHDQGSLSFWKSRYGNDGGLWFGVGGIDAIHTGTNGTWVFAMICGGLGGTGTTIVAVGID